MVGSYREPAHPTGNGRANPELRLIACHKAKTVAATHPRPPERLTRGAKPARVCSRYSLFPRYVIAETGVQKKDEVSGSIPDRGSITSWK